MRRFKTLSLVRRQVFSSNKTSLSFLEASLSNQNSESAQKLRFNEYDPVKSLFYQYKNIEDVTPSRIAILNERTFMDGLKSPIGPLALLSPSEKQKINFVATERLQELEDSGLSKEEVLCLPGKGIPLKNDPFFQIIKKDLKARERLFKDNEEYSAKRIVTRALTQDIGFDVSPVGTEKRIRSKVTGFNDKLAERMPPNVSKEAQISDYYASETTPSLFDYQKEDPLDKFQPMVKYKPGHENPEVSINVNDIHWRNTALLTKFLTKTGRIKHRLKTGLNKEVYSKVRKAIKHSRTLNLLPTCGFLKPYHKIPLRNLFEDLNEDVAHQIDLEHGTIVKLPADSAYDFRRDHFTFTYGFMEPQQFTSKSPEQKLIEDARKYAIYLKQNFIRKSTEGEEIFAKNKNFIEALSDMKIEVISEKEAEACRPAYEKLSEQFKEIPMTNFMELLFAEHSSEIEGVFELKKAHEKLQGEKEKLDEISYENLLIEIERVKSSISKNVLPDNQVFFEAVIEKEFVKKIKNAKQN